MNQPISILNLSRRPFNCLTLSGINTLEDLLKKSDRDVWLIPNLGKISLQEIKDALAKRGLKLKEHVWE